MSVAVAVEPASLELAVLVADGQLVLVLDGPLVNGTTARLRTWMQQHVPAAATRLVLDLSAVTEVDSVGLGALLAAPRRVAPDAEVVLAGARPAVARALRQCGLDQVLRAG